MKNNELILKYLSGFLTGSEKSSFEEKLNSSAELKKEFFEIEAKLSIVKPDEIEVDESYFTNMIPRVRQRIDNSPVKNHIYRYFYWAVPALTIAIIAVLFYPRSSEQFENNYMELAQAVVKNIDDADVQNKYFNDVQIDPNYSLLADNNDFSIGLENAVNKIPDNYLNMVDYSNNETYHSLQNLSDDDLNKLYKELNDFKLQ